MIRFRKLITIAALVGWMCGGAALAQEPAPADANPAMGGTAEAPLTAEQRIEALEQQQAIMQRKLEIDEEARAAKAKETPVVTAGKDGFGLAAADGSFRVRIRGIIHLDGRLYVDDDPANNPDTFTPRRVRPIIEGTLWKYYDFMFVPDFGDGKTQLIDGYLNIRYRPEIALRAGKFKAPVGLERLQSIGDVSFVELALPTNLVPNRDTGLMLYGDLAQGSLSYAFALTNGVPDGMSADRNTDGMFDYSGRVFVLPFKDTDLEFLRGLGVGVAGSSGLHYGAAEIAPYKSAGQMSFFKYRPSVSADGLLTRLSPQLFYSWGPFGLMYEYVESSQEVEVVLAVPPFRPDETLTNTSWQVTASFVLTGEDVIYKAVKPRKPFDPTDGTGGAWQIVGRYNELSIDDDAFPIYAAPAGSARMAHGWAAGLNGYLSANTRVMIDYEETAFAGGAESPALNLKDRDTEKVWFGRLQIAF